MNKILLAEDQGIVIAGMKILLQNEFSDFGLDVVKSTADLTDKLRSQKYEIAILDMQLEDGGVLQTLSAILNLYKDLKVLVFSANPEEIVALPLYVKGIRGYLGKESDDEEIVAAIKSVLDGNIYISNRLKRHILKTSDSESMETLDTLTETELKIVTMLMQGRRVMEISAALNLKPSTISNSKKKIFQKLKVENVMQIQQLMFPKGQQWNR